MSEISGFIVTGSAVKRRLSDESESSPYPVSPLGVRLKLENIIQQNSVIDRAFDGESNAVFLIPVAVVLPLQSGVENGASGGV